MAGLLQLQDFKQSRLVPGDADKDRLFMMMLDNHRAMHDARAKIQTDTLMQIRQETIIRGTCKSAWDGALSCNKWKPTAQTLVPTFTVTWDTQHGRSLPPLQTVWNAPTACTIIPRNTMVEAKQQKQQDAQRNAPMQRVYVEIAPGFTENVKAMLAGFHFRVDVCQLNGTKACRRRFH